MSAKNIPRRQAIPVLYTRGSHYDVGFDMGRTFASMIKNFLLLSEPLNETYIPLYNTDNGKKAYDETLECVKKSFPQYIRELEGVADGAQVEFYKLFLLHMDDILPQSLKHQNLTNQPVGCSTIIVNGEKNRIIGHTEDALTETLNHYYFVVAHIINDKPQGKYNVKEERFMSLCYAGHLPGYTMNYNHHGLVFTINTLSAEVLSSGKTPRHFITRALLSSENYEEAIKIITDAGVGAGDSCSINLTFINEKPEMCYNIEMGPAINADKSVLSIKEIKKGEHNFHANQYERLKLDQANDTMIASSVSRMKTFSKYPAPETKRDVEKMLGDCSGGEHCVFRDNGSMKEHVKTIAIGIFDLNERTLALYSDNPSKNEPHVVLPLILKK